MRTKVRINSRWQKLKTNKKMKKFILYFFTILIPLVGKSQVCEINFGEYLTSSPNNCVFSIGNVDMELFAFLGTDIYPPVQYCDVAGQDEAIFSAKIQKEDIPANANSQVTITLTSSSCPGINDLGFVFHYNDGSILYDVEASVVIPNIENLDYLTITESECSLVNLYQGQLSISPVIIEFNSVPLPPLPLPTCNNSEIQDLENALNAGIISCDHHNYIIEDIICDKTNYPGTNDCSVDGVFNFIKSNNNYQAPGEFDFPLSIGKPSGDCVPGFSGCVWDPDITTLNFDPLFLLGEAGHFFSGPYNVPISDCMEMDLYPNLQRQVIGVSNKLLSFMDDLLFDSDFFDTPCMNSINWVRDPIKIVIDDERRCITNYTMPGHILHPGKVERCVVLEDCGQKIKIVTKGVGYHECHNDWRGAFFSCMNTTMGPIIFHNVSNRVKDEF